MRYRREKMKREETYKDEREEKEIENNAENMGKRGKERKYK